MEEVEFWKERFRESHEARYRQEAIASIRGEAVFWLVIMNAILIAVIVAMSVLLWGNP